MTLAAAIAAIAGACGDDGVVVFTCEDGSIDADQVCLAEGALAIQLAGEPLALRVADFDGDGRDDALVTGLSAGALAGALYRGSPGGVLATSIDAGIHGCSAHPIVGDLDRDAFADLMVPTCEAEVLLFRGRADGAFEPAIGQAIPTLAKMLALADVDGDGDHDLVVLGDDGQLHVLPALGIAAFGPAEGSPLADAALSFAIADLDRDRRGDAILLTEASLEVGLAQPGGVFAMQGPLGVGPTPPRGLTVSDVDGDDALDLLTRDAGDALVILGGDGEGGFVERERVDLEIASVGSIVTADLDGDGDHELLIADADEARVHAYFRAEGRLRGPLRFELPAPAIQLGVGDFNGDGAPDLAAATFGAGTLAILLATP